MAERHEADSDHRVESLAAIVRELQGTGHDAKSERADGNRQHEPVLEHAAAERKRAERHRKHQPDFVHDRRAEQAAGACQQPKDHRRRQAMYDANAGQPDGDPVQSSGFGKQCDHCGRDIGQLR